MSFLVSESRVKINSDIYGQIPAQYMPEYGFYLTRDFPCKDRIINSVLNRGKYRSDKTRTLLYFTQ